ncbi:MAG: peptidylprolyl isomerase [Verrucomicrobia bacterium]|nr:peptidylprolyl isomerase [Verrucomicrobiota bacterium]
MKLTGTLLALLMAAALQVRGAAPDRPAPTNATAAPKPAVKTADLFGNKVVAKGKNVEVTRGQLDDEVIRLKAQAAARNQNIPPEQMGQMERQILEQLIQVQLLQAKATPADKVAGKALAEKRLAEATTRLGSEDALNRQLKLMGATREEVLAKWTESATAETVLKRELKVNITDADAKKYFDDNPARFEEPEMVRASHILLMTTDPKTNAELSDEQKAAKRKQMEGLLKRARAGEDFAKLAKDYSEDPGSKDKGGEYKFPRNQMVPEFEAAAFSLNTNQVSDIVTTRFGYHIIKLSEKIPAKKVEYDKAASDIKEGLTQQALQKQFPEYLAKLKADAGVEILDEKLKAQELPDPSGAPPARPPVKPAAK